MKNIKKIYVILLLLIPFKIFGQKQEACILQYNNTRGEKIKFLDKYNYCFDIRSFRGVPYKTEVYLDLSGSMGGFKGVIVGTLYPWIKDVLNSFVGDGEKKICIFNTIINKRCYDLSNYHLTDQGYRAEGNTNIPDVLSDVKEDIDFVILITDGIGSVRYDEGRGVCARGLDLECFSRSLVEVANKFATQPGIFFIPLLVGFDGNYYSEEVMSVEKFQYFQQKVEEIKRNIREDTGIETASISNWRLLSNSTLYYRYKGPRPLLVIIIGKNSDLARGLAVVFYKKAVEKGFKPQDTLKVNNLESLFVIPIIFPPIEVFPGYVGQVQWVDVESYQTRYGYCMWGNFSMKYHNIQKILEINCPRNEAGGVYKLRGASMSQSGICAKIVSPVVIEWGLEVPRGEIISGIKFKKEMDTENWSLNVSCMGINRNIDRDVLFVANYKLEKSRDCLFNWETDQECRGKESYQLISNLSGTDSVFYPHKILMFREIIRAIYSNINYQSYKEIGKITIKINKEQ